MTKFKILIDRETCIGDRMCCNEAPNTFEMDDDDLAIVTNESGDEEAHILEAAKCCPVDAIKLIDEATGKQVWPEE